VLVEGINELSSNSTVGRPVVAGDGGDYDRPDTQHLVFNPGLVNDLAKTNQRYLWWINNPVHFLNAHLSEVCKCDRGLGKLRTAQAARASSRNQVAHRGH
jgi:hypothetical protein